MSESIKSVSSLKSLLSADKGVELDFPGFSGFKVQISFLSRDALVKIRKKATTSGFKRGVAVETLNDDLFLKLYTEGAIKGWTGLKLSYLEALAPVDLDGQDKEATLEYNEENALFLMKESNNFDAFISDAVTDLSNFPSNSGKK